MRSRASCAQRHIPLPVPSPLPAMFDFDAGHMTRRLCRGVSRCACADARVRACVLCCVKIPVRPVRRCSPWPHYTRHVAPWRRRRRRLCATDFAHFAFVANAAGSLAGWWRVFGPATVAAVVGGGNARLVFRPWAPMCVSETERVPRILAHPRWQAEYNITGTGGGGGGNGQM